MKAFNRRARTEAGFTLVELLVVIAIIGILATIVVPNVIDNMRRARVARALSEVKGAEQALTTMLTDTGRSNFTEFLSPAGRQVLETFRDRSYLFANLDTVSRFYNEFFYALIRQGRNATDDVTTHDGAKRIDQLLLPEIRQKLGTNYMNLGFDPWGEQYNFWMGPQRNGAVNLRSYRVRDGVDVDDVNFEPEFVYLYDGAAKSQLDARLPGNPRPDNAAGFPAPAQLPIYVWSKGANKQNDAIVLYPPGDNVGPFLNNPFNQATPEFWGGGDDVNSWDSESGWLLAPQV